MISFTNPAAQWLHSLGEPHIAWSITGTLIAIPLFIVLGYALKHRQAVVNQIKLWLATPPIPGNAMSLTQRRLSELLSTLGQTWTQRAIASRHLQSGLCFGTNAQSLGLLLRDSAFGFARRAGVFETTTRDEQNPARGFGWAMHEQVLMLGWVEPKPSDETSEKSWSIFLRLAGKSSPFRKIRYLMLCLDVQDLRGETTADMHAQAKIWGERLHLASLALGRRLPIYIVVQGLEDLPGFETYCAQVPIDLAHEPWGWRTCSNQTLEEQYFKLEAKHQAFSEQLLLGALSDGLDQEAGPTSQGLVHFSQSFLSLSQPLLSTIRSLISFRFSNLPVPLRGVYFTGSYQDQGVFRQNLIRRLNQMSQKKSPLLPKLELRQKRSKQLAVGALGLCISASWMLPWSAAQSNRELQDDMQQVIDELNEQRHASVNPKIWAQSFKLDQSIASIRHEQPWSYRFGMSQTQLLEYGSHSLFVSLTMRWGVLPMISRDHQRIKALSVKSDRLSPQQTQELQNRLFRYLLLSQADRKAQPELKGSVAHRLSQSLAGHWAKHHRFGAQSLAKEIAQRFVEHLAQTPKVRIQRDPALLELARTKLRKQDLLASFARYTIQAYDQQHPPIEVLSTTIPAAFSAPAWNQTLSFQFQHYLGRYLEDAWVLGLDPATTAHLRANAGLWLSSTYANAFEQAWKQALQKLGPLPDPTDLQTGYRERFEALSDKLKFHTKLKPIATESSQVTKNAKDPISQLPSKFSALIRFSKSEQSLNVPSKVPGLPQYLELLHKLSSLQAASMKKKLSTDELDTLLFEVTKISSAQPKAWRSWFKETLSAPMVQLKDATRLAHQESQSAAWCELSQRLHRVVFDRYPFKKSAAKEVQLAELSSLLHPSRGELWRYLDAHLANRIEVQGGSIRAIEGPKSPALHPRLIKQLNSAWKLANVLFPEGADAPHLSLLVRAQATREVSQLGLRLDDHLYRYPSKEPLLVQWPSQSISARSRISIKHPKGLHKFEAQGTWSLFRLLESGRSQPHASPNTFFVTWPIGSSPSAEVRLTLRVQSASSPFFAYSRRPMLSLFRSRWLQSRPPLFEQEHKCQS